MEFLSLRPNRVGRQQTRRRRWRSYPGGTRRSDVVRGKLEFKDVEEILIGDRTYKAIKLESSDSGENLYIDNNGKMLLLERKFRNWPNAYIRLLHPSEY